MFYYIGAHLCELNTNPGNKAANVMRLTRWYACPTDYMNKLKFVCLCWRLNGKKYKTLLASNVQYILHLKKTSHQGNLKQRFSQFLV